MLPENILAGKRKRRNVPIQYAYIRYFFSIIFGYLRKFANDERHAYPRAVEILKNTYLR